LEILDKKLELDPEATICLRKAFLRPYPRVAEGQLLVEQGVKTAIDISDGLISDLNHICELSQVGACIDVDRLPIEPTLRANFGDKSLELALSGGEDYELLFTGSERIIDKVRTAVSCPVTVIGEVVADETGRVIIVDGKGNPFHLQKTGWEHFTTR
jgi:thiamine-monophosphate kinase